MLHTLVVMGLTDHASYFGFHLSRSRLFERLPMPGAGNAGSGLIMCPSASLSAATGQFRTLSRSGNRKWKNIAESGPPSSRYPNQSYDPQVCHEAIRLCLKVILWPVDLPFDLFHLRHIKNNLQYRRGKHSEIENQAEHCGPGGRSPKTLPIPYVNDDNKWEQVQFSGGYDGEVHVPEG